MTEQILPLKSPNIALLGCKVLSMYPSTAAGVKSPANVEAEAVWQTSAVWSQKKAVQEESARQ